MVGRQRVLENIALNNVDPRTLRQVRELLPCDGTGARQFKQRSPQIGVARQDRNEERAGATGHIENLMMAAEVVIVANAAAPGPEKDSTPAARKSPVGAYRICRIAPGHCLFAPRPQAFAMLDN